MDSLLSGPYASFMVLGALVVFAGLFWDLMQEMRDGAAGSRAFGAFWRRRATKASARTSRGFERANAPPPPRGRESLQFSGTLETWTDRESGEITGRVMAGAYRGRGFEELSRTDCLRLNEPTPRRRSCSRPI